MNNIQAKVNKKKSYSKYIMLISLLLILIQFECSSPQQLTFKPDTNNDWLTLQNVGFQIKDGNVIWTAGGNFKVNTIKEVLVNHLKSNETKELMFKFVGDIPKGFYLTESKPLKGAELNFLKDKNATKMFIEVILVNDKGETKNLYTPVSYSSASKETIRTVLNIQNPNWDK